jgi:tetratricopeptide (TPR) repeat protein
VENNSFDIVAHNASRIRESRIVQDAPQRWLRFRHLLTATGVVVLVLVAYWPSLHGSFIWDDDFWTTIPMQKYSSLEGLLQMLITPTNQLHQYAPLTAASFWVDFHLWGFGTFAYHLENLLLHLLSVLLLWELLRRFDVPGAGFAAILFAIHPINVESVAWITERKNVLSLPLYLGSLLFYCRLKGFWGIGAPTGLKPVISWQYVAAFLLFLLAFQAKATVFALPAVLLLIGWWRLGEIRWRRDIVPTLPFFLISLTVGFATEWIERNPMGANGTDFDLSFATRCLIAGHAFWFYLQKLLWPASLCFNYPKWQIDVVSLTQWMFPLGAVGLLIVLWLFRARLGRGPFAAVLYFVGTALPLLGFVSAYYIRYSYVADHWTYLPNLSFYTLFSAISYGSAAERLLSPKLISACRIGLLTALSFLTSQQATIYRSDEAIWTDTVQKNPTSWMGWSYLGSYAQEHGDVDLAMKYYYRSTEIHPSFEACYNLGKLLFFHGRANEAIPQLRKSIELRPDLALTHQDLGIILASQGSLEEAVVEYRRAIQLSPQRAYSHYCLGAALERLKQPERAAQEYEESLRLQPDLPEALRNLAWIRATDQNPQLRDAVASIALAEKACQLTKYQESLSVSTLAAAYAEAGRWQEAVETAKRALTIALKTNDLEQAVLCRKLINEFEAKHAHRQTE